MSDVTSARRLRFGSAVALLVLGAACGGSAARTSEVPTAGEWLPFGGSWTASGTRTVLDLEGDHKASIIRLNGSLLLAGENKPGVGFRAELIAFADSRSGLVGRSVWTDERGDRLFSELSGQHDGTVEHVTGTFLGGTGRFAGATGDFGFSWRYLLTNPDGSVGGRTSDVKGRLRIGAPPAAAPSAGGTVR